MNFNPEALSYGPYIWQGIVCTIVQISNQLRGMTPFYHGFAIGLDRLWITILRHYIWFIIVQRLFNETHYRCIQDPSLKKIKLSRFVLYKKVTFWLQLIHLGIILEIGPLTIAWMTESASILEMFAKWHH